MARQQDPLRHTPSTRKISTTLIRRKWRTSPPKIKLTPVQQNELKAKRRQRKQEINAELDAARERIWADAKRLRETFGIHDEAYYHRQILQAPRLKQKTRKPSRWHAYLSNEVKKINEGMLPHSIFLLSIRPRFLPPHLFTDLPDGEKKKVAQLSNEISRKWNAMSLDEQKAATEDLQQQLEETREMKQLSTHNVPINAFKDGRATLDRIQTEVGSSLMTRSNIC